MKIYTLDEQIDNLKKACILKGSIPLVCFMLDQCGVVSVWSTGMTENEVREFLSSQLSGPWVEEDQYRKRLVTKDSDGKEG